MKTDVRDMSQEEYEALLQSYKHLVEVLKLVWQERTGQFGEKSCGHHFTCICVSEGITSSLRNTEITLGEVAL